MSDQEPKLKLNQDIILVFRLINVYSKNFFIEEDYTQLNAKNFQSFTGISKADLDKLYESCSLKSYFSYKLSPEDVFIILATIAPWYYPDIYKSFRLLQKQEPEFFSIVGGKVLGDNKCFYPTGETIIFLLAGHNILNRVNSEVVFNANSAVFFHNLISLSVSENGTPRHSGQLIPSEELLALINGKTFQPEYSSNFPASRLETRMEWVDLVLPYETHEALEELKIWMKHGSKIIEHKELGKRIKPGYKTLFYGPPGTGKTLTASLIGKNFGREVYRIDLSMLVSKWVGETEKNLKGIFDLASNKNWILFFDEADSLFGKRTSTNSSNDRYANQEVSYLLQRIEEFPGLVILASNLKSNIDEAFNRRFQSTILFPMPSSETRLTLWQKAFPKDFPLEPKIDLRKIANKYEMAGGAIINIVRFCVLMAMERQKHEILLEDIEHSIIREFKKEGKIVS